MVNLENVSQTLKIDGGEKILGNSIKMLVAYNNSSELGVNVSGKPH